MTISSIPPLGKKPVAELIVDNCSQALKRKVMPQTERGTTNNPHKANSIALPSVILGLAFRMDLSSHFFRTPLPDAPGMLGQLAPRSLQYLQPARRS